MDNLTGFSLRPDMHGGLEINIVIDRGGERNEYTFPISKGQALNMLQAIVASMASREL